MRSHKIKSKSATKEGNHLAGEKSPYLLQHANNPVDWYPWDEAAFARAYSEDKPIFLSIGYSSCHWCHVMEKESFEDKEIAELINQYYIPIKVDREERPDIDNIYMSACQAMTGSGGWPLTIVMTPDGKPFFAGTYFPKYTMYGRQGLLDILTQIAELWEQDRNRIIRSGDKTTEILKRQITIHSQSDISIDIIDDAFQILWSNFDNLYGGFGSAPKFPSAHNLSLLLRWWKRSGDERALIIVEKTLQSMYKGGIFDQLGYGFHRYSTDSHWLVPHFEKMLYDQAMLIIAYTETYQATGSDIYKEAAEKTIEYVLRDMSGVNGGFYSAEDADSEGTEGEFYIWTEDEIKETLGENDGEIFCEYYGISSMGNFEGKNVLWVQKDIEQFASERSLSASEVKSILNNSRELLFKRREARIHPFKDDKILTDWNGLMIAALSKAARAFENETYAKSAKKAVDFILDTMRTENGRLLHRYRSGEASIPGYLDDYAFLIWGLIELYETTFDVDYLETADNLTYDMLQLFNDNHRGGLFFTGTDTEELLIRTKEIYDGAIPSGNSVAAYNLLKLGRLTSSKSLEEYGIGIIKACSGNVKRQPTGYTQLLTALDFLEGPVKEIIIAGDPDSDTAQQMLKAINSTFIPNKIVALNPGEKNSEKISALIPYLKHQKSDNGRTVAYVCQNYKCGVPEYEAERLMEALNAD